jgi:hypothetical protein
MQKSLTAGHRETGHTVLAVAGRLVSAVAFYSDLSYEGSNVSNHILERLKLALGISSLGVEVSIEDDAEAVCKCFSACS